LSCIKAREETQADQSAAGHRRENMANQGSGQKDNEQVSNLEY
jgi:hypothetical protein